MNFTGARLSRGLLLLCLLAASIGTKNARAENVSDLYFQEVIERYFEYPQNARTFGMAGSSVVTSTDSSAVVGNPAGLGMMQDGEISATYGYNRISGDEFPTGVGVEQRSSAGSGMFAVPVGPNVNDLPRYGNFGAAWTYNTSKWDDDSFGTEAERTQVVAAYAYPLSRTLSLGYSLGWTDDRFQSNAIFDYPMGNGFRHTVGALWKADRDLTVGATLVAGHGTHHALFGPGIKGDSRTLEFGADLGVSYQLSTPWTLALQAGYRHLGTDGDVVASIPANVVGGDENGNIFDAHAGVEYAVDNTWKLRGGYRFAGLSRYNYNRVELNDLNGSAYYSAFTAGAGYVYPLNSPYVRSLNLDYGVEYRLVGDNDWQHVVTLSVPFNVCREG